MGPDANLEEQRQVSKRLLAAFDAADPGTGEWHPDPDDVYHLAELSSALDGWMSRGGALPHAWRPDIPTHHRNWKDYPKNWWESMDLDPD